MSNRTTRGVVFRSAALAPESFDRAAGTVEVIWSTGAPVRRVDLFGEFDEELAMEGARLGRLNAGAAVLFGHRSGDVGDIVGAVVPGTARIEDGAGVARLRLYDGADAEGVVDRVEQGVLRHVSIGYIVHAFDEQDRGRGVPPLVRVTDFEPLEVSLVPIPADAGASIRTFPKGAIMADDDETQAAAAAADEPESTETQAPLSRAEVRRRAGDRKSVV